MYTNRFIWNGGVLLAVVNDTDTVKASFLRGLDLKGASDGEGGPGGVIAVSLQTNGSHFCAYDGNGNSEALVNGNTGATSGIYEYDPFGSTLRLAGSAAKENPLRFSSQFADDVANTVKFLYRDYSMTVGRWLSRDPIEEGTETNPFGFLLNATPSRFDRDGRVSESSCNSTVDVAKKTNAKIKAILAEMKRRNCPDPGPICRDCCSVQEQAQNRGAYLDVTSKVVHICSNKYRNAGQIIQALAHELIHALDDCKGTKWEDCEERACSEIRAYDCSGECAKGGVHYQENESYTDCIERVATASTLADPKCTAQHVKNKMNDCLGTCPE
jgi:RHS repeat-associated protein